MDWHARLGYAVLALLLFRLVWGFVGGRWSRFASFLYAPRSVLAYLRGQPHPDHLVGHNPLGAGSVFAMLAVLLAQVATGLVSDDEIAFTGPAEPLRRQQQGRWRPPGTTSRSASGCCSALVRAARGGGAVLRAEEARRTWCGRWSAATRMWPRRRRRRATTPRRALVALAVLARLRRLRRLAGQAGHG